MNFQQKISSMCDVCKFNQLQAACFSKVIQQDLTYLVGCTPNGSKSLTVYKRDLHAGSRTVVSSRRPSCSSIFPAIDYDFRALNLYL